MIDKTSTGTQIFGPEFFKSPTPQDEFVLIKIGSQIALTLKEGITPLEITIITLSQIWLAHMRFVFDKTPISHSAIMASIRLNVQKKY